MQTLLYYFFKIYVSTGLFFYNKRIRVVGANNVPKKGAVLFLANHPNGLIDPLLIATNTKRKTHFLVRAAVFNNKVVASFFNQLGMMPIYRIRDGVKQLSKNEAIFNKCFKILNQQKSLLIFPEGSHLKKRTIRPLSKGFTRIVFGALEKHPDLKIQLIPVGITYQNSSKYPGKVAIHYGSPILANDFYNKENLNESVKNIKDSVSKQLQELSVHIPNDENYNEIENTLNKLNTDYTEVTKVNHSILKNDFKVNTNKPKNFAFVLKTAILINSIIPYSLWKLFSKKVSEIEFIDTFRFGVCSVLFPIFYFLQGYIVSIITNLSIGITYTTVSFLLALAYSKTATTLPE